MTAEHSTLLLNSNAIRRILQRISHEIAERNEDSQSVVLIGIQRGGVILAERIGGFLQQIWGHPVPVGQLDVSMHRDDLDQRAVPDVYPTRIPADLNDKVVVLMDDVLFSGRTTRAALDAIHDLGRPRSIQLAVLVDRGHRQLPIKPDFVGKNMPTRLNEQIRVLFQESGQEEAVYLVKS